MIRPHTPECAGTHRRRGISSQVPSVYGDSHRKSAGARKSVELLSKVQGSLDFQSRFTDTFVKRKGRWQVVARHYSRIPAERTAVNLDSKIYDAYVGQYEIAPDVVLDITKEGEKLMSQTTGQPKMELLPESEIEFFIKGFTAQFVFVRDESGRVTKLIVNQEGQRVTARKLK